MDWDNITFRRPDDAHWHPRDGRLLEKIADFTSAVFPRAMVKGNLSRDKKPDPIYRADQMIAWCQRIVAASHFPFKPLPTIMMVKQTTLPIVQEARKAGAIALCLIPEGASTNSEYGVAVADLPCYYPIFEWMEEAGMPFSVHPELNVHLKTGADIPEVEREHYFMPVLEKLARRFPGLIIIAEHLSTKEGVDTVLGLPNVFATLTVHHMILTTSDVLDKNGQIINPDNYCKPIAKSKRDRRAVIKAATSGNQKFMAGSDSAAHWADQKKLPKPNAGVFSAPILVPAYASVFEKANALDKLGPFLSEHFARLHRLPFNKGTVTLLKRPWQIPHCYEGINLFQGGQIMDWQVA